VSASGGGILIQPTIGLQWMALAEWEYDPYIGTSEIEPA
jgi:hypothetical protein